MTADRERSHEADSSRPRRAAIGERFNNSPSLTGASCRSIAIDARVISRRRGYGAGDIVCARGAASRASTAARRRGILAVSHCDERLLNALATRASAGRVLPETEEPGDRTDAETAKPAYEIAWLEPYPDSALEQIPRTMRQGPDAKIRDARGRATGLHRRNPALPPRQRATLLLTDVLGWSAAESARLLDSSVAAVEQCPAARPHDTRRTAGRMPASGCGRSRARSNAPSSNATFVPGRGTDVDALHRAIERETR